MSVLFWQADRRTILWHIGGSVEGAEEAVRRLQEMQQVFVPALFLWYFFYLVLALHVIRFEKKFSFSRKLQSYNLLTENSQIFFKKVYSILKTD